ncbi:MAG: protein kinase [Pirellulales bacterium]
MLKCPFCSYDYSEHGLRDGRCPSCGSVLAWEGGSGDVPDDVRQKIFAQTMQSIRPGIRVTQPTAPPAAPPATATPAAPAAATPPVAPAASTPASADGAYSTIKPSTPGEDVPSAALPLNPRSLRDLPKAPGMKTEVAIEKVIGKTATDFGPLPGLPVGGDSTANVGAQGGGSSGERSGVAADASDVGKGTVPTIRKTVPVTAPLPVGQPRIELGDGTTADAPPAVSPPAAATDPTPPERLVDRRPDISSEILRTITPASLSPEEAAELSQVWKEAAGDEGARPHQTLKGHAGGRGRSGKISDTQLVIQTRSVVNKQENQREAIPIEAEYELLNVIGRGGVGVVYLARQSSIDRDVAIKMLRRDRTDDPANRDKFLAEAVVTGDLDHPNIVPIYDLGTDPNGALFYSMKRVQGTPWNEVLAKKSLVENLEILLKVSDAIAFAHARGIVHRDIKAENVMLGDFGEVLVMDWGIALPMESYGKSSAFLRSQGLGGSPAYMAPEMVTGPIARIGAASDVYLLGATLFEIVTGRPPHMGRDVMECLMSAARNDIIATDKSGELLEIALRAMATRIEDRYASVQAFQAAIRDYESHAESILLSSRAAEELEHAKQTRDYEGYSRAVFGFQEALNLWSGNRAAVTGLNDAKVAYAAGALEKGDFDLGLSLLDSKRRDHFDLYDRLTAAVAERDARQARLRYVRRLVVALVLLLFLGGTASFVAIVRSMNEAKESAKIAKTAEGVAKGEKKKAEDKEREARVSEEKAKRSAEIAETARTAAVKSAQETQVQRQIAEDRGLAAEDARQEVEESSYFTEINVVAAKIRANSFDVARQILREQAGNESGGAMSRKARYRHWEWARLRYLSGDDRHEAADAVAASGGSHSYRVAWPIEALTVVPGDQLVAIASRSGQIELRSRDNQLLGQTQSAGGVAALAFSADGQRMATGASRGGSIQIWAREPASGLRLLTQPMPLRHGNEVRALAFAPGNPRQLYSVSDNVLRRWEAADADATVWRESLAFHGHLDRLTSVSISQDGAWVLTGSEDSTVRLWNATTGREVARFRGHDGPVYAVAFAPDGRWFASAGFDTRILAWSMPDEMGKEAGSSAIVREVQDRLDGKTKLPAYFVLAGHSASVRSLAFSTTNHLLVSAGQDNTAIVWDAAETQQQAQQVWTGKQPAEPRGSPLVKVLRGHGTWIRSSAVSRDAQTVFTHSNDGSWRRWDLAKYDEVLVVHDADSHSITAAQYLGDGRTFATAHSDGAVRLWESATGREIGSLLEGHEFLTTRGAFFPDGKRAFTAAGDGTTRIWNVETCVELHCLHGTGRRGAAAVSSDGRHILTGGSRGVARWWNADTGQVERELPPPSMKSEESPPVDAEVVPIVKPADVTAVAISPGDDRAITGDSRGRCWLWSLADGSVRPFAGTHGEAVSAVYFLPESDWRRSQSIFAISTGLDGRVIVWNEDLTPRSDRRLEASGAIDASVLSRDGRSLVFAASLDERRTGLWWWDVSEGKTRRQLELAGQSVNTLEFGPQDVDSVILSSTDFSTSRQVLRSWSWNNQPEALQTPNWRPTVLATSGVWHASTSPDGSRLLTVGGSFGRIWDAADGRLIGSLRGHSSIAAMAASPDGKWLATAGSEGAVKLWNVETRESVWRRDLRDGRRASHLRFSPDGKWLLAVQSEGIELWDRDGGQVRSASADGSTWLVHAGQGGEFTAVAFAPDGRHIATVGIGAPPTLWRLARDEATQHWTAAELRRLGAGPQNADASGSSTRCIEFSRDGQWIVTGGDDRIARLWSFASGRLAANLEGHSATITCAAFSADGLRVLTGSDDARVMLWDARGLARWHADAGDDVQEAGHEGGAEAETREIFTLSRYVAAASDIDVDDIEDKTHGQSATSVEFSPDGLTVLTTGADGAALLWPGVPLEPSLDVSLGKRSLIAGAAAAHVDDRVLASRPSAQLQQEAILHVTAVNSDGSRSEVSDLCSLTLVPAPMLVGQWSLDGEAIRYRSPYGGEPQEVGRATGGRAGEPLVVELRKGTPSHVLESVARSVSVTYPVWAADRSAAAIAPSRTLLVQYRLGSTTTSAAAAAPESRVIEFSLADAPQSARRTPRENSKRGQR